MTKEETISEIIRLCEDENGFFVQLRVYSAFNEQLYRQIVDSFSRYQIQLDKDETVNRRAIGYLFDFLLLLNAEWFHFEKQHHPDTEKLLKAYNEALALANKIFP